MERSMSRFGYLAGAKVWSTEDMERAIAKDLAQSYNISLEQALEAYRSLKPVITEKSMKRYLKERGLL